MISSEVNSNGAAPCDFMEMDTPLHWTWSHLNEKKQLSLNLFWKNISCVLIKTILIFLYNLIYPQQSTGLLWNTRKIKKKIICFFCDFKTSILFIELWAICRQNPGLDMFSWIYICPPPWTRNYSSSKDSLYRDILIYTKLPLPSIARSWLISWISSLPNIVSATSTDEEQRKRGLSGGLPQAIEPFLIGGTENEIEV